MGLLHSTPQATVYPEGAVYPLFDLHDWGGDVCGYMTLPTLQKIGVKLLEGQDNDQNQASLLCSVVVAVETQRSLICSPSGKRRSIVNLLNPSFDAPCYLDIPSEMQSSLTAILSCSDLEVVRETNPPPLYERAKAVFVHTKIGFTADQAFLHKRELGGMIFHFLLKMQLEIMQSSIQNFPKELAIVVISYSQPFAQGELTKFRDFLNDKIAKLGSNQYALTSFYRWNDAQVQKVIANARAIMLMLAQF